MCLVLWVFLCLFDTTWDDQASYLCLASKAGTMSCNFSAFLCDHIWHESLYRVNLDRSTIVLVKSTELFECWIELHERLRRQRRIWPKWNKCVVEESTSASSAIVIIVVITIIIYHRLLCHVGGRFLILCWWCLSALSSTKQCNPLSFCFVQYWQFNWFGSKLVRNHFNNGKQHMKELQIQLMVPWCHVDEVVHRVLPSCYRPCFRFRSADDNKHTWRRQSTIPHWHGDEKHLEIQEWWLS